MTLPSLIVHFRMFSPIGFFLRVLRTHVFVVVIVVPEESAMSGFVVWARVRRRRRRIERGCVSRRKYGTMLEKEEAFRRK